MLEHEDLRVGAMPIPDRIVFEDVWIGDRAIHAKGLPLICLRVMGQLFGKFVKTGEDRHRQRFTLFILPKPDKSLAPLKPAKVWYRILDDDEVEEVSKGEECEYELLFQRQVENCATPFETYVRILEKLKRVGGDTYEEYMNDPHFAYLYLREEKPSA